MYNSYRPNNTPSPRKKRRLKRVITLFLIVLLIVVVIHVVGGPKISGLISNRSRAAAKTMTPVVLTQASQSQMSSVINSTISSHPDIDIGVVIEDLNNSKFYQYGLSEPFIAASTAKLITATMYLKGVQNGKYSLNQQLSYGTAQYELQQMIVQSDNTAWEDFNTILTHEGLASYAAQMGMTNYDPDQNTLTVNDIALLLGKLYKGELLSHTYTQMLLSYMQDADETDYIVADVPAGVKVYHKAGWLDDRINDAAIIDNGKHPYVLVIFTKDDSGTYDADEGHVIYNAITDASLKAFL